VSLIDKSSIVVRISLAPPPAAPCNARLIIHTLVKCKLPDAAVRVRGVEFCHFKENLKKVTI
jgi:hypothetical protein